MFLLARFFQFYDVFYVPLCFIILYAILRSKANRTKEKHIKRLYYRAFGFKLICVLLFTLLTEYYFKGGDTNLYYQGTLDLRAALKDDVNFMPEILQTLKRNFFQSLVPLFLL